MRTVFPEDGVVVESGGFAFGGQFCFLDGDYVWSLALD